ncbi:MAG: DNA double-strand break repair nuclease NurA [Nitrososphaeria archaeon]
MAKQINLSHNVRNLYEYLDHNEVFDALLNNILHINRIKGRQIIFTDDSNGEFRPLEGWGISSTINTTEIDVSRGSKRNLIAVDSSSISIAETEEGGIYAVKGAGYVIVDGNAKYKKLGPLAVYIGLSNIKELESILGVRLGYAIVIDKQMALKFVRHVVESMLIEMLAEEIKEGIALVDGSLKEPPFSLGRLSLQYIMEKHKEKITFVGISKGTSIKALRAFYSAFMDTSRKYADITDIIYSITRNEFGRKYLVKLDETSVVLRADIYSGDPQEVFSSIIKSDNLVKGYPESLLGAHLLSLFMTSDVHVMRTLVAQNASKILLEENMRKFVLGHVR